MVTKKQKQASKEGRKKEKLKINKHNLSPLTQFHAAVLEKRQVMKLVKALALMGPEGSLLH